MSREEDHEAPVTTTELTPVTTAVVPVSTTHPVSVFRGGIIPRHLYPIPYYTPWAPQYFSRIRGMLGMTLLRWSQFNVELTQETYLLTQGPRRDSQFDMGLFPNFGGQVPGQSGVEEVAANRAWIMERSKDCKEYLLPKDEEEEDDVEQCPDALERAQKKFHWDLEEVIRAIPDMVVQVLQAARGAQLVPDQGAQQQVPRDQINQPRDALVRPSPDQQVPSPALRHPAPQCLKDLIKATFDGNPGIRSPYPGKLKSKSPRVSDGAREPRMKQGLCLKCGEKGHFAAECGGYQRQEPRNSKAEAVRSLQKETKVRKSLFQGDGQGIEAPLTLKAPAAVKPSWQLLDEASK
ncbi:UNVERIFIED_CONTAM: hypothetical protein K2H54_066060 [Gekko kuhli]